MRHDQIALQLYTLRQLASTDLAGTLRAVSAAGYRAVEVAGLPATDPGELARLLGDAGLRVAAVHEGIEHLRADLGAVSDRAIEIGSSRVIVPWMPEDDRRTADDVRRFVGELGEHARTMAGRGIQLGYHNHAFEFAPLEGTTVWDIIVAELSPEIELEVDVYWAAVGGQDPVALIRALGDRVRLLHMKDRDGGPEERDAPPGEGTLAFPEIIDAARTVGVEWYIVEQDVPRQPLDDIASAFRYLTTLAD